MHINQQLPTQGMLLIRARTHVGDGRYEQMPVAIGVQHIVSLEFRHEVLDWSTEERVLTARIMTSGLEGSEYTSSSSLSYQIVGEDAKWLYRLFMQDEPGGNGGGSLRQAQ